MKEARESLLFKNKSIGYKIFIVILCIISALTLIFNVLNFSVIYPMYSTIKKVMLLFHIIIMFLGIGGYLANKRNLSLIFVCYYFIKSIYVLIQNIVSFTSIAGSYSFNQIIMPIITFSLAIIARLILCFFAYKFLLPRKYIE